MKTIKSQKVKINWVENISDLQDNTVYIENTRVVINKVCCDNVISLSKFSLDFDKESALIKDLIICPKCDKKYFIAKGKKKSNYCPTANFIN